MAKAEMTIRLDGEEFLQRLEALVERIECVTGGPSADCDHEWLGLRVYAADFAVGRCGEAVIVSVDEEQGVVGIRGPSNCIHWLPMDQQGTAAWDFC